jgi:hypothetical protein
LLALLELGAGGWPEEVSSKCLFTSYCGWEKLLEMSAQQGNDKENHHDSNNGDQDKRQNLLFLPLLVPIVRNFRLLRQASTFLHWTWPPHFVVLDAVPQRFCLADVGKLHY